MIVLAEYAHSNSKQFFTKIPPFHTKYTYQPRTSWPTEIKFQNPSSEPHGNIMMAVENIVLEKLVKTQKAMGKYYNTKRRSIETFKMKKWSTPNVSNVLSKQSCRNLKN
jgi:hypothetical protein